MKVNTGKLYEQMSSEEKANIYQASNDMAERDRIVATVPKLTYKALDYEFKNRVDRLNFEQMTFMVDWFRNIALMTEAYHDNLMIPSSYSKQLANMYLSNLVALEESLDIGHKEVLQAMGSDINTEGYAMVYELEPQPELVEHFRQKIKQTREEIIEEIYF